MKRRLKFILLAWTSFAVISSHAAHASEKLGILPPDIDYKKVCVVEEKLLQDNFDWTNKTPASSGLSPEKLLQLAKLYYNGSAETPPDWSRTNDIVDYLTTLEGPVRNEALFIKYDMLLNGKFLPQNSNLAKAVLDDLIKYNDPKAYSRYGDLYVDETDYLKAAEYYRKAVVSGEPSSSIGLAYLYHDHKIPGTDEEIKNSIIQAQNAVMHYLVRGNCHALTLFGLMYSRLDNLENSEFYSAKWFEKASEFGDPTAKLKLAELIKRGFAIQGSEEKILTLWTEAANLGSARAMYLLGEYYALNHKNDQELKTAQQWLEKAADFDDVKAAEMLAGMYAGRYGVTPDPEKRQDWLERASESSNAKDKTFVELAETYEERGTGTPEKILSLYQMAAAQGNLKAYIKLGDAYRYGLGTQAAPTVALRYYRLGAANGDTYSMRALQTTYHCGMGTRKDPDQEKIWTDQLNYYSPSQFIDTAFEQLEKLPVAEKINSIKEKLQLLAITRNNTESMILLSFYAQKTNDKTSAKMWLDKALKTDIKMAEDYAAHTMLGKIYLQGVLVPRNENEAVRLLELAAHAGNATANNELGRYYKNKGDLDRALKFLSDAAQNGKDSALVKIADIQIEKNDIAGAIKTLETAAQKWSIEAALRLADGYTANGWIGQPDPVQSKSWFDKALSNYPCQPSDYLMIAASYLTGNNGAEKNEIEGEKWLSALGGYEPEDEEDKIIIARATLFSRLAMNDDRRNNALKILEKLAQNDNDEAIDLLVQSYLNPNFPDQNVEKAIFWLSKNADRGHVPSMKELGQLYLSGYRVPASLEKAEYWLKKAASTGDIESINALKHLQP